MRPLKWAPSSMLIRAVEMSPVTEPSFLISTLPRAWTLPTTLPETTTSPALISELSWAVEPTISSWPRSEIGPCTLPSICKSSSPVTWPLISMLAPRRAELREGELPRREVEGALKGTTGDEEPRAGEAAGGSATACDLDHIILPPLFRHKELTKLRVGWSSVNSL